MRSIFPKITLSLTNDAYFSLYIYEKWSETSLCCVDGFIPVDKQIEFAHGKKAT